MHDLGESKSWKWYSSRRSTLGDPLGTSAYPKRWFLLNYLKFSDAGSGEIGGANSNSNFDLVEHDPVREDDVFGDFHGVQRIETGWLTAETVLQFKISNGPINFWRKKHKNATVIKSSPSKYYYLLRYASKFSYSFIFF